MAAGRDAFDGNGHSPKKKKKKESTRGERNEWRIGGACIMHDWDIGDTVYGYLQIRV